MKKITVERNEPCTAFFNEVPKIRSNVRDHYYAKNKNNGDSMNPTQHVMLSDQSRELTQGTIISVQEDKLKNTEENSAGSDICIKLI